MDSGFLMGSMGTVVGEKITYAIEKAIELKYPIIIFSASFASIADIVLSEPGAMIGFAGQRVIEQTIGESLPDGFQTAEFLLEHGFIDKIVERKDLKHVFGRLIELNG